MEMRSGPGGGVSRPAARPDAPPSARQVYRDAGKAHLPSSPESPDPRRRMESPEPVLVRPAAPADTPALAALATHLGYPTEVEQMRARLSRISGREDYETFVAERDGRVVGFAGVMHGLSYVYDPPYARLLSLVVEPEERGRGTGAALVAGAERWAREHGAEALHLTTALHREGAHRFYEGQGYERTGARYLKKLGPRREP